jgi:hypothetical protein
MQFEITTRNGEKFVGRLSRVWGEGNDQMLTIENDVERISILTSTISSMIPALVAEQAVR